MHAIICTGDSIVFGRGASADRGWVSMLADDFSGKDMYNCVYNMAIPGDGTRELLVRLETELKARALKNHDGDRFDIIIGIGINDSRMVETPDNPQMSVEEYRDNISKIFDIAKKYGDSVTFIGLTNVDESLCSPYETTYFSNARIKEFNDAAKEVAEKKGVTHLPLFGLMKPELLADGLHPNDDGYSIVYDIVKDDLSGRGII